MFRSFNIFVSSFVLFSHVNSFHFRCGKCRRYIKYIQTKPSRLHCAHCNETYSLPQNGNIRIYKELKCPLDDFELLSYSTGARGKSYVFCPYCYNNPPFRSEKLKNLSNKIEKVLYEDYVVFKIWKNVIYRDMKKGMSSCNMCTHPTCPHGMNTNGISCCPGCDSDILVFDPSSGPKWKLVCNRCDVIIYLFENAHKVYVNSETCDNCGAQQVTVEYKPVIFSFTFLISLYFIS